MRCRTTSMLAALVTALGCGEPSVGMDASARDAAPAAPDGSARDGSARDGSAMDGSDRDGSPLDGSIADADVVTCDAPSAGDPGIDDLIAVQSPTNVLAYIVSFTSPVAGRPSLTIDCQGLSPFAIVGETDATEHELFVMGLIPDTRCALTAALEGSSDVASACVEIEVAPLPDYLPEIEVMVPATRAALDGWTLINLTKGGSDIAYTAALVDLRGRLRWYYQYPGAWPGADTPVMPFGSGVLIGGRGIDVTEVSWDGRQVWTGPRGHHDVRPSLEPGRVYYLTDERACNGQTRGGGGIVEWDYEARTEVWHWYMCEHYTPGADVGDWSHLNTIAHFGDGASLLISSRNQNSIMRVDRATGAIEWSMGFNGRPEDGFHGDFEMEPADRFYQQHDPEVLESGNILLFDNGHATERAYSRAIELAYEHDPDGTSRAEVVWEYRHSPDLYTPVWGDADRLEGGNTLVTFGRSDSIDRTRVVEVTPEGEVAWEIALPLRWGTYRAERMTAVPRGFVRE